MTKREALINYLKSQGVDITRAYYIEEKKLYQKPGTVIIKDHYLNREEQAALWSLDDKRFDDGCPIEIHRIRDQFKTIWGLQRVFFKQGADWRKYAQEA